MPFLYALAQHDALDAGASQLQPGEMVLSFLDDLYVVTTRSRAHEAFRTVAASVEHHAGVKSHLGKLRFWCRGGGEAPEEIAQLGAEIWTADKPPALNGIKVLGTPLGTKEFTEAHAQDRIEKARSFLTQIEKMRDP